MTDAKRLAGALFAGAAVGFLGGLVGLGGAEFRLPLLIGVFGYAALDAVILNKAMSLAVVATAIPARATSLPWTELAPYWPVVFILSAGSMAGAWRGADMALRLAPRTLHRLIAALLLAIAIVLQLGHDPALAAQLPTWSLGFVIAGVATGFVIGMVAAVLGVAGGELLIPAIVMLAGADLKLAGSLALLVSFPTMLVGFARYSRDSSFQVLRTNGALAVTMAAGSVLGSIAGGKMVGMAPVHALLALLTAILVLSAWKIWRQSSAEESDFAGRV